jgi:hypothetical protein
MIMIILAHKTTMNLTCVSSVHMLHLLLGHILPAIQSMTATVTNTLSFREKGLAAQIVAYGGGVS